MILKSLSVFAVCAAFGAAAASPLSAQKPNASVQGRSATPPSTQPGKAPAARPSPWWQDEKSKKDLGLSVQQVKQIDDIWNSAKDEWGSDREIYERERKELDRMIAESKVAPWVVRGQIDKTETARSTMNKLFLMTLYRMHQLLTPEQRVKLQDMADKGRSGGRGADRRDPKPAY